MSAPKKDDKKAKTATKTKTKTSTKAAGKEAKKPCALDQVMAMAAKAFPNEESDIVEIDEDTVKESLPHIPTGSTVLNYAIGGKRNRFGVRPCPGFPRGRIINLYGYEASGKTTLALTAAAQVIAQGGAVLYIDWENAIVVNYAKALGVPTENKAKFLLVQPTTLEKGLGFLFAGAKAGVDLIVVDSVGAAIPKDLADQGMDEIGESGRLGLVAAKWSTFLPKLISHARRSGSCIIGISQLRAKINTDKNKKNYGPDYTVQGGNAWGFYSSLKIMLQRISNEKGWLYNPLTNSKEEAIIGGIVMFKLEKCKVSSSQGGKASFYVRYGEGIDDLRSVIEIAAHQGIVKKDGSWYTWERSDGATVLKGQGKEEFKTQVRASPEAWKELYLATMEKLNAQIVEAVSAKPEEQDTNELAEIEDIIETKGGKKGEKGQEPEAEEEG